MYQLDLLQPTNFSTITHINLNYHELECVRFALIGLSESIKSGVLPKPLSGIDLDTLTAQFRYLNFWLQKPELKSQLFLDGSNSVLWPFSSSELVDWLLTICRFCISNEVINLGYNTRSKVNLGNEILSSNSKAVWQYYCDIVKIYQPILVDKLIKIQEQKYPLYPKF